MPQDNETSCLHGACDCRASADGEGYCSDACRTAHRSGAQNACHCGHEGCGGT